MPLLPLTTMPRSKKSEDKEPVTPTVDTTSGSSSSPNLTVADNFEEITDPNSGTLFHESPSVTKNTKK